MRNTTLGSAVALLAAASAVPAAAQDDDSAEPILVQSPLIHPAAGLMNEHMHDGGEFLIGLRFERFRYAGPNEAGDDEIADPAIVAAGYSSRASAMTMDMLMLDLMFAPNDDITLMVMPHYMWHRMEMVGIDPAAGSGGGHGGHHGGHAIPFGETHEHSTDGFGDTLVSASYRLARSAGFGAHATLGLWVPTGSAKQKNPDGTFVHYGMQPGGGTWDIEPSLTLTGRSGLIGWGGQAAYRWKTDATNTSGFAFGDKARATGWVSYLLGSDVVATTRLEYVHEGKVQGHYDGSHNHSAPPDRQENYGGDTVSAGLGLNWLLPVGGDQRPQLSAEISVPFYQNLNGIQAPLGWRVSMGLSQAF
jgi:hypothetical protein